LQKRDIRVVAFNWYRPWAIVISKKPIRTLDDWRGLKIRLPPSDVMLAGFLKLGVSPTPIAYGETLMALQQGVVEAGFIVEDSAYSMGWYEAAKYLVQANQNINSLFCYFSEKTYRTMTPVQQELLVKCANEAGDFYAAGTKASVERAYTAMKAAGVEVIPIETNEWKRWQALAGSSADELEAAGKWEKGLFARAMRIMAGQEK